VLRALKKVNPLPPPLLGYVMKKVVHWGCTIAVVETIFVVVAVDVLKRVRLLMVVTIVVEVKVTVVD
jgi:hypothetical protein